MERWPAASAPPPNFCGRLQNKMTENATVLLTPWSSFYVMAGSSAAALTGLMFVVITLVKGEERLQRNPDGIATFSTPTVMHFCAALLVSAMLSAPWRSLIQPAFLVGLVGLWGIVYVVRVMFKTKCLTSYVPDAEDWTWYTALPLIAYGAVLGGALGLALRPGGALFAIAGGVVVLIFIGIRNAWDVVTFLATGGPSQ
jgi:hypothetical protein